MLCLHLQIPWKLRGAAEHLVEGSKNAVVGWPLNFRVHVFLKSVVKGDSCKWWNHARGELHSPVSGRLKLDTGSLRLYSGQQQLEENQ